MQIKRLGEVQSIDAWKMLGWLLLVQITVSFVGRSLSPLGPLIEEDLMLTKTQIGMLPAALFLGQSFISLPSGYLVDRFGSRIFVLLLCSAVGLFFVLFTMTESFWLILFFVFLAGFGYGSVHPATNRGIMYWFATRQRGTAMGIKQMGVTFGSALSALFLLQLSLLWGWRKAVLAAALALMLVGVLSFLFYRDPEKLPVSKENRGLKAFFVSVWKMARHRALLLISAAALGLNGTQMCLNTYIVFFAYERLNFSLFLSGILLVISEVSGSIGRIVWGIISDRLFHGRRVEVLQIVVVLTFICCTVIALLPASTEIVWVVLLVMVFGFSISGFNGIWMNAAAESVDRESSGLATGFSISLGSWGAILIPPLFGWTVDQTGVYSLAWILLAFLMLVVLGLLQCAKSAKI